MYTLDDWVNKTRGMRGEGGGGDNSRGERGYPLNKPGEGSMVEKGETRTRPDKPGAEIIDPERGAGESRGLGGLRLNKPRGIKKTSLLMRQNLLALSHRMRYGHPLCIGTSHLSRWAPTTRSRMAASGGPQTDMAVPRGRETDLSWPLGHARFLEVGESPPPPGCTGRSRAWALRDG